MAINYTTHRNTLEHQVIIMLGRYQKIKLTIQIVVHRIGKVIFSCILCSKPKLRNSQNIIEFKAITVTTESNGRLNLKVGDFYNDFKDACNYIISQN